MAVSMAATGVVSGPVIAGQKFTYSLTLTESGGTSTNLVSIQPFAYLAGLSGSGAQSIATGFRWGTVANAATIGGYTGAAVTINASTSKVFNFDGVVDTPFAPTGAPASADPSYYVSAMVQTSDGSVFQAPPLNVTVNQPQVGASTQSPPPNESQGQSKILGTSTNQYSNTIGPGSLRFDVGSNSYFAPIFA